jgi:hypothetical protein
VTKPWRQRWLALLVLGVAVIGALAGSAASRSEREEGDAFRLVRTAYDHAALRTRVGERSVEKPVLSPGLHWVALPERPVRDFAHLRIDCVGARSDERTLCGWCLAHSTSTALS